MKIFRCFFIIVVSCIGVLRKKGDRYAFGILFHLHRLMKKNKEIKAYKKIHKGARCFIIGTGSSLKIDDIERIKGEYTIGVNTLYKYFSQTAWRPSYYCLIDPKAYENIKCDFNSYDIEELFYASNRIFDRQIKGIPFLLNCSDFYKLKAPNIFEFTRFNPNADKYIYDGASVVYAAMELAVYMGFTDIYLLGVDCNYTLPREQLHPNELSYSEDYDYKWNENTSLTMIEGFKIAKKYADLNGIHIYNATRGGMLEVFPRVKLEEIINDNNCEKRNREEG